MDPTIVAALINAGALIIVALSIARYVNKKQVEWQHTKSMKQREWDLRVALYSDLNETITNIVIILHQIVTLNQGMPEEIRGLSEIDYFIKSKKVGVPPVIIDSYMKLVEDFRSASSLLTIYALNTRIIFSDAHIEETIYELATLFSFNEIQSQSMKDFEKHLEKVNDVYKNLISLINEGITGD